MKKRFLEFNFLDWLAVVILILGLVFGFGGMQARAQMKASAWSLILPPTPTHNFFFSPTTWYVRQDGGTRFSANVTSGMCNGKADAAYPGTTNQVWTAGFTYTLGTQIVDPIGNYETVTTAGTSQTTTPSWGDIVTTDGTVSWTRGSAAPVNQACAFREFRYLWDDDSGSVGAGAWVIAGGDTVYVKSCGAATGQTNPSNPTCRVGWDNPNGGGVANNNLWCQFVGNQTCYNPTIPAGSAGAHTRILGGCMLAGNCNTGTSTNRGNLTQIFGGFGVKYTIDMRSTQYVDIQGIELTTHNGSCSHAGSPGYPAGCSTSSPVSDYADSGFQTNNTTANITFQDVYADGFESSGFFGPIGGPITMTRVNSSFNAHAGWDFDDGSSTPDGAGSSIAASYVTMNGNGCKQEYPVTHSWPALACWDDLSGGFGDAWSGQNTTIDSFTCDHCVMEYNTKDAFIGPHMQAANLSVTNSFSVGNMGAQMKYGITPNATVLFQNNLFVMNCFRQVEALSGATHSFNASSGFGGAYLSDFCRAGGDGWSFLTRANSTIHFYGNTLVGANATMMDMNCGYVDGTGVHEETNCGTSPLIWKDNNFLGFTDPIVGAQPGLWYFDPGAGGSLVLSNTNNNYFGVRNIAPDVCGTNNITCANPLMTSQPTTPWPGTEAALDVFNPASTGFYPTGSSPLVGAGVTLAGLTMDFYAATRPNPPSMGAVEPVGTPTVATPTASPAPPQTSSSPITVTLSTATSGATICPTIDGSTPTATVAGTCDGPTYTAPLVVSTTTTINAIATKAASLNSGLFSGLYTITVPSTPHVIYSGTVVFANQVSK